MHVGSPPGSLRLALAGARDHALVSLLALNGLRISEALGADIEDLAVQRNGFLLVGHAER